MTALKILFLLPLSILSLKMTAQIDDLLKNKDITWVAGSYNDFALSESDENKWDQSSSHSLPLKLVNKAIEITSNNYALQEWLLNAVENGQLPIYDDEFLLKKHTSKQIFRADTITQIDPTTLLTNIKVIFWKPNPEEIPQFRAKQIIYYNVKKAQFGMLTIAIAPIYTWTYNKSISFPLFWFKPKDLNKSPLLSKKNITWARRMTFAKGISMDKDSIKIIKNTQETTPMVHFLTSFETNPKIHFYKQENFKLNRKIDFRERKTMFVNQDTIVHWKENEEKPQFEIVNDDLKASELVRLQLLQNWYWNNRKKRLEIQLVATAPMKEMYFGPEFSYHLPVFYRRTDD